MLSVYVNLFAAVSYVSSWNLKFSLSNWCFSLIGLTVSEGGIARKWWRREHCSSPQLQVLWLCFHLSTPGESSQFSLYWYCWAEPFVRITDNRHVDDTESAGSYSNFPNQSISYDMTNCRQYKFTYGANIFCCILCGTFASMFDAPARYMWFAFGLILFAGLPTRFGSYTEFTITQYSIQFSLKWRKTFVDIFEYRSHVDIHRAPRASAAGAILLDPRVRKAGAQRANIHVLQGKITRLDLQLSQKEIFSSEESSVWQL
jgi:hypothetical protein